MEKKEKKSLSESMREICTRQTKILDGFLISQREVEWLVTQNRRGDLCLPSIIFDNISTGRSSMDADYLSSRLL